MGNILFVNGANHRRDNLGRAYKIGWVVMKARGLSDPTTHLTRSQPNCLALLSPVIYFLAKDSEVIQGQRKWDNCQLSPREVNKNFQTIQLVTSSDSRFPILKDFNQVISSWSGWARRRVVNARKTSKNDMKIKTRTVCWRTAPMLRNSLTTQLFHLPWYGWIQGWNDMFWLATADWVVCMWQYNRKPKTISN